MTKDYDISTLTSAKQIRAGKWSFTGLYGEECKAHVTNNGHVWLYINKIKQENVDTCNQLFRILKGCRGKAHFTTCN